MAAGTYETNGPEDLEETQEADFPYDLLEPEVPEQTERVPPDTPTPWLVVIVSLSLAVVAVGGLLALLFVITAALV